MDAQIQTFEDAIIRELALRDLTHADLRDALKIPSHELYEFGVAMHRLIYQERIERHPDGDDRFRLTLTEYGKRIGSDPRSFGC